MKKKRGIWKILTAALLGVALALVIQLVMTFSQPRQAALLSASHWRELMKISEVMRLIRIDYVDGEGITYEELGTPAIEQMLTGLDPHTSYLSADFFEALEHDMQQAFVGVGIEINRVGRRVTVMHVFPGSPAEAAGMAAGDRIVVVEEENTEEETVEGVVNLLRGEAGSRVAVTVERPPLLERIQLIITRERVTFPHVRDVELREGAIGYLRLTGFGSNAAEEFIAAVDDLKTQGMRALMIDMRGNGGGILEAAVTISGHLLEPGKPIVSTRGRGGELWDEEVSTSPDALEGMPVAVLIDGNSASASEVVAGALQDNGRAIVVGETSFGKGSVQTIFGFPDGSGLKLTTARYYLPSGRTIHGTGVEPDIVIELSELERGNAWALRGYKGLNGEAFARRFGFPKPEDRALQAARELLTGLLALGGHHAAGG